MTRTTFLLLPALIAVAAFATTTSFAAEDAGAQTIRPAAYKPVPGDARLGEKLFNDPKLSTIGMSCASCHANRGAFSDSFATPYPHIVAMARNQLSRESIHLDEMIQACMIMPMQAQPLAWDSTELAALVTYVQILQKTFKPSR